MSTKPRSVSTERWFAALLLAVGELKQLKARGPQARLFYKTFLERIGLKDPREPWHPIHMRRVTDVLNVVAVVARQSGEPVENLAIDQVVQEATGKPGKGFYKTAKLVAA